MAASLIQNALQINFDSVLSLSDEGMGQMFKDLESSGLRGFLGCSCAIYEKDLVNFFENGLVSNNTVISSVQGKYVSITEEQFAGMFDLSSEDVSSVNDLPANLINKVRTSLSANEEPMKTSFTHERFLLMTTIRSKIKINWSRFIFDILKGMVTPSSKQARGFAVQLSILLKGVPVGEPWRIRIPSPGEAAEEQN
ncbi:hypothetical protein F511_29158 [Dorcoceras hygrometricum]|uniref:Dystroglycan-like n=1 Tax=Dorcoceras hygrometricum TaxID=472368 RepID=A0A2Z7BQA4_9LAMI|nr:hypothetical protein F511_29158 [Dorcoceras hygrometricum]